ncbi:MAG: hypothetical protein HOV80_27265 [Polyangiaceae bacterium]|nr:hypothetical protein [Polyangiaceae bacterium]
MPLPLLWILAQPVSIAADAVPAVPGPLVTTMMVFGDDAATAPPPLAADLLGSAKATPAPDLKPYDPAPLWLDTLFVALGSRPNYIAREKRIGLDDCDARDPRCDLAHADLARLDADGQGYDLVGSALTSAFGLLTGPAKDRPLFGSGIKLRGRGRFVGIVMDW